MKWIFGFLLMGLTASAMGQSIYKCRDTKGQAVYQSDPCPEAEKRWDTPQDVAEQGFTQAQIDANAKIEADRRHMRQRARDLSSRGRPVGASITGSNPGRCESAKRDRDAVLKAAGLSRNFQMLRALDDAVWNACK